MMNYLLIGLGGALGSVGRVWLGALVTARASASANFPWGTLAVNVLGSFVIGWAAAWPGAGDATRRFLTAGVCGGFTTFSAFSLQTLELTQRGEWLRAAANVAASVLLCLAATAAGQWLGAQK